MTLKEHAILAALMAAVIAVVAVPLYLISVDVTSRNRATAHCYVETGKGYVWCWHWAELHKDEFK